MPCFGLLPASFQTRRALSWKHKEESRTLLHVLTAVTTYSMIGRCHSYRDEILHDSMKSWSKWRRGLERAHWLIIQYDQCLYLTNPCVRPLLQELACTSEIARTRGYAPRQGHPPPWPSGRLSSVHPAFECDCLAKTRYDSWLVKAEFRQ